MVKDGNLMTKYLSYMKKIVCNDEFSGKNYSKLFRLLLNTEFVAVIENDDNRIADAADFRAYFETTCDAYGELGIPISVLEVMVALADRCENSIMGDILYGDRTPIWFWYMVESLGLLGCTDDNFDKKFVEGIIFKFINRDYEKDGRGGLFYVPFCPEDLRKIEIWYQMNWWLNTIED